MLFSIRQYKICDNVNGVAFSDEPAALQQISVHCLADWLQLYCLQLHWFAVSALIGLFSVKNLYVFSLLSSKQQTDSVSESMSD